MKRLLRLYAVSLLVVAAGCGPADETSTFNITSPDAYNQQIMRGRQLQQAWTTTPHRIMQYLLGPDNNEEPSPFEYRQVVQVDSVIIATVTEEGIQDDAVYGKRTVLTFVRAGGGGWVVKQMKVGYKCREDRGQSEAYSGTWCN